MASMTTITHLTVSDAAARLGVSRERVRQFIRAGRLRSTFWGGWHAISSADLERFAARPRKVGAPKKKKTKSH